MREPSSSGSPVDRVREALEAFRHDEAMERVRRARGAEGAESESLVAKRHAALATPAIVEALDAAARDGALTESAHAALRAHLARARADLSLAAPRDALSASVAEVLRIGRDGLAPAVALEAMMTSADPAFRGDVLRALSTRADELARELVAARAAADEAGRAVLGGVPRPPDAGPEPTEQRAAAESFLEATAALGEEATRFAQKGVEGPKRRPTLADLLRALRFRELDGHVRPENRARRFGQSLAALGFERDLAARVRVSTGASGVLPRARVVAPSVPNDVRVLLPGVELGLVSELAATEALGRALATALASPALPFELRRPIAGSVGRAWGVLFAAVAADRVDIVRSRGLAAREAEGLSRRATTLLVLDARFHAVALVARGVIGSTEERVALAAELLSAALFVDVDHSLATLVALTPAALGPRLRARFGGHGLALALRERFDEDWPRNPRAAEALRSMAARGGGLSIEAAVVELGGEAGAAPVAARLSELFG